MDFKECLLIGIKLLEGFNGETKILVITCGSKLTNIN